jgi:membrane protease YdiL (CAAX protease family)
MKRWSIIVVVLLTLLVFETDSLWWRHIPLLSDLVLNHLPFSRTVAALRVVAAIAIVWLTTGRGLGFLGLGGNPLIGVAFALIASAPLWATLALTSPLAAHIDLVELAFGSGYFPLSEEIVYRAFAFGLLHRAAGAPFWIAAVLTAVPFAAEHLYQAGDWGSAAATIAITLLGALLFSWLFAAWSWNLWVPFALHAFMNLWWSVFDVGDGAFAGWAPTAMQFGCAAVAVLVTLLWRRRRRREVGEGAT